MKKTQDLVSIILPIVNNQTLLPDALDSLLKQSYKHLEIIAIDDKSTDKSFTILKTFRKKDKRLRVYRNIKRYGLAVCLNRALKHARGSYITFMDPTDISTRARIRRQLTFLLEDQKTVAVGTQCTYMHKNKIIGKSAFPLDHTLITKSLLTGTVLQFETAMIAKERLPKDLIRFQKKTYPLLYSELFLKMQNFGEITNLPAILVKKRIAYTQGHTLHLLFSRAFLWVQSAIEYGSRPSFKSLFTPLLKQA